MGILLALIPAIGWGMQPLIARKVGGSPANQIFGTGLGAFIIGIFIYFIDGAVSGKNFWISFAAGLLWSMGQVGQYITFNQIGVTKTMPISTGLQIIGTSLIGVLIFGEWAGAASKWIGAFAILLVIIGVSCTSITDQKSGESTSGSLTKGLAVLIPTTIGYWAYSALPKAVDASGLHLYFPEMLGIFIGAVLFNIFNTKGKGFLQKAGWYNILVGIVFGIGSLVYIYAAQMAGVASAFVITQLNVVVSTIGGMLLLHESKTPRELKFTITGLVLIVGGSFITAFL